MISTEEVDVQALIVRHWECRVDNDDIRISIQYIKFQLPTVYKLYSYETVMARNKFLRGPFDDQGASRTMIASCEAIFVKYIAQTFNQIEIRILLTVTWWLLSNFIMSPTLILCQASKTILLRK